MTVKANQETNTVESSQNKKSDGFQSEIDKKLDILQESISKLTNQLVRQEEENPEGWCLTDIMAEEQCEQQPHQKLIEDFIELSEGLAESSNMCDVVFPRENQEEIIALLIEEGSEKEPQKLTLQPIPMKLNPSATAQATYNPLPVYILPPPAANSKPVALARKAKSNPSLPAMQIFKKLVANIQAFATISKTQEVAYIAWHIGWFGCRFGVGAPEPWHFYAPPVLAASEGLRKWFGGSTISPTFCFNFSCFVLFYRILF